MVAKDSNQLNGYTEAASASWGPQVATAGSSAASERREHQCWQCPSLHKPLTAATTCLLQALKQQYDGNLACSGHGCCNTPWQNMRNNSSSCLAGPAAVNSGCVSWLEASVSLAAHAMASKLPGVAHAQMLLQELAKKPSVQCAKVGHRGISAAWLSVQTAEPRQLTQHTANRGPYALTAYLQLPYDCTCTSNAPTSPTTYFDSKQTAVATACASAVVFAGV